MIVAFPFSVITGAVVSTGVTTFTVLLTSIALFPAISRTLYNSVYVPATAVFTVPVTTMLLETSPSILSIAVAPASTYTSFTNISTGLSPFNAMIGAIVSGIEDIMFTV